MQLPGLDEVVASCQDLAQGGFAASVAFERPVPVDGVMQQGAGDQLIQGEAALAAGDGEAVFGQAPASIERTAVGDDMLAAQQAFEAAERGHGVDFVAGVDAVDDGYLGFDRVCVAQGIVAMHFSVPVAHRHVGVWLVDDVSLGAGLAHGSQEREVVADRAAAIQDGRIVLDLAGNQNGVSGGILPGRSLGWLDVVLGELMLHDHRPDLPGSFAVLLGVAPFAQEFFEAAGLADIEIQAGRVQHQRMRGDEVRPQAH